MRAKYKVGQLVKVQELGKPDFIGEITGVMTRIDVIEYEIGDTTVTSDFIIQAYRMITPRKPKAVKKQKAA